MKISWDGIEFGKSYLKPEYRDIMHEPYYFKWGYMDSEMRKTFRQEAKEKPGMPGSFGLYKYWYDCPHAQLNLGIICFYWSTPWTTYDRSKWE